LQLRALRREASLAPDPENVTACRFEENKMLKQAFCAAAVMFGLALPAAAQPSVTAPETPTAQQPPQTGQLPSPPQGPSQSLPSQSSQTRAAPEQSPQAQDTPTRRRPRADDGEPFDSAGRTSWRGARDAEDSEYPPRWRWQGRHYGWGEDGGPDRWRERRYGRSDEDMTPAIDPQRRMPLSGLAALCGPNGARIADMMINRIERATQPSGDQRSSFEKLKDAVGKATETMRATCTTDRPITPPGRLEAAEKRLTAMLEAVRTVRPALDSFYGSLTDEQKIRLTLAQRLAQRHMLRQRLGEGWREGTYRDRGRMRDQDVEGRSNIGPQQEDDDDADDM
jgi:hypothetical protein